MVDLKSPKQDGEKVYTTLQLTRMLNVIDNSLRAIKAVGVGICVIFVVGTVIYASVGYNNDQDLKREIQTREDDTDQRRFDACERDNEVREANRLDAQTTADGFAQFAQQLIQNAERTPQLEEALTKFHEEIVQPQLDLADPVDGPNADRDCSDEALGIK